MANSIYSINKGINLSIEFRGLKAQYIWYMAGGVLAILILFVIVYVCGLNTYICLTIAAGSGIGLTTQVYKLSNTYGEHGLAKKWARKQIPTCIRAASSRDLFMGNLNVSYGKSDERNIANHVRRT